MKKIWPIGLLLILIIGCEKNAIDVVTKQYVAKIVDGDMNCSTCILSFPDDSLAVKALLGESENNYYQAVNLDLKAFRIGQRIKVNVRKANSNEIKPCITLYPSFGYESIFVSDYEFYEDFALNDTINIGYGDCLSDVEQKTTICFESVITDSRCPENTVCIWAGEAIARFRFKTRNDDPITIDLLAGTVDTLVYDYRISFLNLLPYPNSENQIRQEDYKAIIIIRQK
ncbi:MAG: hypothetical protein OEX02_03430 [Cyclobacteriaceae bacterium]|nr:hypothetical protein [Cyclobacteriaceae bacterium]